MTDIHKYNNKKFVLPAKYNTRGSDIVFLSRVEDSSVILKEETQYTVGYSHPTQSHVIELYMNETKIDTMVYNQKEFRLAMVSPKCSLANVIPIYLLKDLGGLWAELCDAQITAWFDSPYTSEQQKTLTKLEVGRYDRQINEIIVTPDGNIKNSH